MENVSFGNFNYFDIIYCLKEIRIFELFLSKSEFKLESQIITKTPTNHFSLISLILAQIRY